MHRRLHDDGTPACDGNGAPSYWWPHGWSWWNPVNDNSVRYNCKYIQKDLDDAEAQGHLGLSRLPPLGAKYFEQMAHRYAAQGIAPQTLDYNFPDVLFQRGKYAGQRRQFRMAGRSAEMFLEAFIAEWERLYGGRHVPNSELLEEFMDKGAWATREATSERFIEPTPKKQVILRRGAEDMSDWEIAFYGEAERQGQRGVRSDPFEQHQQQAVRFPELWDDAAKRQHGKKSDR